MTGPLSMTAKVEEYLAFRRGLGYRLLSQGRLLRQFGAFADASGHRGPLTVALALRWARLPEGRDPRSGARRLEVVRGLAQHLAATESGTEVPPRHLLGPTHRRTIPHIFSDGEVAALLAAARQLGPPEGLRPQTYATLLGLLACTGLRIAEALHLTEADADLDRGVLTVRRGKFGKTRLVPLHPTAAAALRAYAATRDRLAPRLRSDRFFVGTWGQPLPYPSVRGVLRQLCERAGVKGTHRRPRLHDLRHTFACRCVQRWYEMNADLAYSVSALAVYLGHAKVSDTYWYLTATPDLLARAAGRFESFAGAGPGEVQP